MTSAELGRLREAFLREWGRYFPGDRAPELPGLWGVGPGDVRRGSETRGYMSIILESLRATEDNINRLKGSLRRELVVKKFLARVLDNLNLSKGLTLPLTDAYSRNRLLAESVFSEQSLILTDQHTDDMCALSQQCLDVLQTQYMEDSLPPVLKENHSISSDIVSCQSSEPVKEETNRLKSVTRKDVSDRENAQQIPKLQGSISTIHLTKILTANPERKCEVAKSEHSSKHISESEGFCALSHQTARNVRSKMETWEGINSSGDKNTHSAPPQPSVRKFTNKDVQRPPVAKKPVSIGRDKKLQVPVEVEQALPSGNEKVGPAFDILDNNRQNSKPASARATVLGGVIISDVNTCALDCNISPVQGISGVDRSYKEGNKVLADTSNLTSYLSQRQQFESRAKTDSADLEIARQRIRKVEDRQEISSSSVSSSTLLSNTEKLSSAQFTEVHASSSELDRGSSTEMSCYTLTNNLNRLKKKKKKKNIEELLEDTGSSLLSIRRKSDMDRSEMENEGVTSSNDVLAASETTDKTLPAKTHDIQTTASDPDSGSNCISSDAHRRISDESSDSAVDGVDDDADNYNLYTNIKEVFGSLISCPAEAPQEANEPSPRTPNYENWTINRALTTKNRNFYSFSDDDGLDNVSTSSTASSPCLSKVNEDSGLSDATDASGMPHSNAHTDSDIVSEDSDILKTVKKEEISVQDELTFSGRIYRETDLSDDVGGDLLVAHETSLRRTKRGSYKRSGDRLSALSTERFSAPSDGDDDTCTPIDSSYDETDSAREGILKMRELLVKGVLDSEKSYLAILSVLIHYKRLLEACSSSSQPVISKEDIQTIFSNIETVNDIHTEFVKSLEPKVKNWDHGEKIGEIFEMMISKLTDFGNYLNNYQVAVSTVHKCCQESEQFAKLAMEITVSSATKEKTSLEDALFKPVQRVQRNTLVLHDLIKYTPEDHPDYKILQNTLKLSQQIIEKFATQIPQIKTTQENRRLVKSSFLVELVGSARKLRYMFLFSDILVCTKREKGRNSKTSFDIKWFAHLSGISIDTQIVYTDEAKSSKKDDVEELKKKLHQQKKELKAEMRKSDDKDKHRTLVSLGGGAARSMEKFKKKVHQTEAQLILAYPNLPFKVLIEGGKSYTLLMSTDYEREEWRETIVSLHKKFSKTDQSLRFLSSIQVQELVNSVKETPQVNKIGSVLLQKDEDILTGILNVTIHKVNGLTEVCDTYCNIEMDSFGHFFFKARTTVCSSTRDPAWNEDFDLELEGSQTLRVLCFRKLHGNQGDRLLGRGALELGKHWLKGSFQEKTLSMNEISLVISLRHTPVDRTMQRTPSRTNSAVFGVSISVCAKREGKTVPTIVTACVQEVEKRGLNEVGIYRVSGMSSELQNIKKLVDKNVKSGIMLLQDVDIHAVTGVLKLYLRELPEPLFTEACYHRFIDTLRLSDEEAKTQCMLALLHGLPDTNYYTAVYLLEHLIKVARNVGDNRMSIHNLATIFGLTLLAPASKQTSTDPLEIMFKGAEQALLQSSVISFFLGLAISGKNLRRSAQ